jgi:hypothetical protein
MSKNKKKRSGTGEVSWTDWLKEHGLGLDHVDDTCRDNEFRTARSNDLNFAMSGSRGGGRVYPRSSTIKRKTRCERGANL